MKDWTLFQKLILRTVPFRLNQFLQTKVWNKGVYFGGMREEQHSIAANRFFESLPEPKCPVYGPPFDPPWTTFPDYPGLSSMGFRMGSGEDFMLQFQKWYASASDTEITNYKVQYPAPDSYDDFYRKLDEWHRAST